MKKPISRDRLSPLQLTSFNLHQKVAAVLLVFFGSLTVGLIPIVYGATDTPTSSTTSTYSSEADLWGVLGEKN